MGFIHGCQVEKVASRHAGQNSGHVNVHKEADSHVAQLGSADFVSVADKADLRAAVRGTVRPAREWPFQARTISCSLAV